MNRRLMKGLSRRAWKALAEVDGFEEGSSIFDEDDDDVAYFVDGTQVAEMTEPSQIGLRLTRKVISAHRDRLRDDRRVDRRRSGSDWIIVTFDNARDIDLVVQLAELSAAAHLPPPGQARRPPPSGADLARRRRFH